MGTKEKFAPVVFVEMPLPPTPNFGERFSLIKFEDFENQENGQLSQFQKISLGGLGLIVLFTTSSENNINRFSTKEEKIKAILIGSRETKFFEQSPIKLEEFYMSESVLKSVKFLKSLMKSDGFVDTNLGADNGVPMNMGHVALAFLTIEEELPSARLIMDWLLGHITTPEDPDAYRELLVDGKIEEINFAGSWWDHFHADGSPYKEETDGRAEEVGFNLIVLNRLAELDPSYLEKEIKGRKVIDLMIMQAEYLTSPHVQNPDGTFNHRPDYKESFDEEIARMLTGLRLTAKTIKTYNPKKSKIFSDAADKAEKALIKGDGIEKGMPFDFLAKLLYGIRPPEDLNLFRNKFVNETGVKNWDWQLNYQPKFSLEFLKFFLQNLTNSPAPTLDFLLVTDNQEELFGMVDVYKNFQRDDGSFPEIVIPNLKWEFKFGSGNNYVPPRWIILLRHVTELVRTNTAIVPYNSTAFEKEALAIFEKYFVL